MLSLAVACAVLPRAAQADITAKVSANNAYGFGFGSATSIDVKTSPWVANTTAGQIIWCVAADAHETYVIPEATVAGNEYVYLLGWGDSDGSSSVVAGMRNADGDTIDVTDLTWEACDLGAAATNAEPGGDWQAFANAQIASCTWVAASTGWFHAPAPNSCGFSPAPTWLWGTGISPSNRRILVRGASPLAPPPAPTIVTPAEGSVTSDTTPSITGVCETGATVTVFEGAATLCTATCVAAAYACDASALAEGLHTITASQEDAEGNVSASAPARNFTVDTVVNAPTIATPTEGSTTSDNTPNITGVCETGATVTIREGAATLCTATCAASAYSCTSSALTDGLHSITATQVDLAGNTSAASPVRNFTVDTAMPSAPTIEAPADGSSGVDATPIVSGTCQTGTLVTVREGAQVLCTASCVADAYACEASTLAVGDHTLTAIQTDDLGQDSPASAPVDYEVVADSDEDGLSDEAETNAGTDPTDADSDDDGVPDGDEPDWNVDSDGDGLINALDADSDNDGLFDGTELGLGCGLPATDAAAGACIADADAGATTTNPLDADTDDGGVRDGAEDANHNGALDLGETDPNVGADDAGVVDTDGDELSDAEEDFLGTDPNDADSDDDGVPDGQEANPGQDSDGDGLINGLDPDSDNDGLFDGTEQGLGCDHPATDAAAGQCVADTDPATTTSPLNPDTDGGGVSDGDEDANGNGAVDPGERDPNDAADDGDGPIVDEDRDGDGVADDDDNCPDVANANQADQDADALGDACDDDADGDGFVDGIHLAGGKIGCSAAQAPSGQLLGLVVLALAALRRRRKCATMRA